MVSGPVGKAKDVDGEKKPDRVKMFDPEIKKGSVKHKGYPVWVSMRDIGARGARPKKE
jgi:hypothetical protein